MRISIYSNVQTFLEHCKNVFWFPVSTCWSRLPWMARCSWENCLYLLNIKSKCFSCLLNRVHLMDQTIPKHHICLREKNLFSSKSPLRSICPIYLRSISQAESKLQPNSHSKDVHSIRKMLNSDFNHVKNMSFSTFAAKNVFIQFVARSISSRLIEFW